MTPTELTAAREELHLTQSAMARVLDIDRATLIRWENGTARIPMLADLALITIRRHRASMAGAGMPYMGDVLAIMNTLGVSQDVAVRSFGVEP